MSRPLFEGRLRYCIRCCIPETEEGVSFDELGICQACNSSEEKMHIDWVARERELRRILQWAKDKAGDNYDCIIPISGGKDSTFQLHVLVKVYGMKPLAVTFNHNWYSETGWYNLMNALEVFQVDHIMFTPNRGLVNRLARRSLEEIGDPCWHCHAGVGAFPLQVAVKFGIPLLVYGEPAAEGHNLGSYYKPIEYDREYFTKVSARRTPQEMECDYLSPKDLFPFRLPSQEECERVGVKGIHLGAYIFWDDERQTEFVRDTYGWRETDMEQAYKRYKSVECIMPGMHDFTLYLKRGYSRATMQANVDVRNGLLTRAEGLQLAAGIDPVRPEVMDYFLEITGLSEAEFYRIMEQHRLPQLQGVEMPVLPKERPHRETLMPFPLQLIRRLRPSCPSPRPVGEPAPAEAVAAFRQGRGFFALSLGQMLDACQRGLLSPLDTARACLRQVERLEESVQAWVVFSPSRLLDQARASLERGEEGAPLRPLEGIPLGVKDIFNTCDFPTQMGSPLWQGFTPGNDARVVFNLRRQGALIPGKTVTAEFAVHTLGKTRNPHDGERNPGTSSSGSAAAVATGMVPVALGTQTAGSIVRPASYCGVYGMKPSFGLVPRTGILKTTDSLDTVGFFCLWRSDLARMWEAVVVKGENYPLSHAALSDPRRQRKPASRPWRVALVRTHTWEHAAPYAREALLSWGEELASQRGVEVEEVEPPSSLQEAHQVHATIYNRTLAKYFQGEYQRKELVSPIMNRLIEQGLQVSPAAYRRALERQEELAGDMDRFFRDYDVLVCLSTAGHAPRREDPEPPDPALMWTLTYLPVVSVPAFVSPRGLPFGLQVVARRYNDRLLLSFLDFLASRGLVPPASRPSLAPAVEGGERRTP